MTGALAHLLESYEEHKVKMTKDLRIIHLYSSYFKVNNVNCAWNVKPLLIRLGKIPRFASRFIRQHSYMHNIKTYPRTHIKEVHYPPVSETPSEWRFVDGLIMTRV